MENKKLLKFLLVNLSELEELVAEKGNNTFDDFEMEFLQSRLKESKKLVQRLAESQSEKPSSGEEAVKPEKKEKKKEASLQEKETKKAENIKTAESKQITEDFPKSPDPQVSAEEISDIPVKEEQKFVHEIQTEKKSTEQEKRSATDDSMGDDMELEDDISEVKDKRLGDSFLKGKSVNELLAGVGSNLEHKLSNRPVASIQTSIGINDRFQYTRELFDGSADVFNETVKKLDQMDNIHEAVKYLQQNFKWKKNETSLKFVNLVKRRFLNE